MVAGVGVSRRWWVLPVVSAAQLLVVLDGTIVNIALPSAQRALGMSDAGRQWVITAYALAFGGLLLAGGRVSGRIGHRRALRVGLAGFAVASAVGGLADAAWLVFAARAVQGGFAALLAPAGLAVLAGTFTADGERGRAFGVFAAVGAAGSAVGLVAGGLLTEYASWRWCLLVNVPVAAAALAGTVAVAAYRPGRRRDGLDLPGVVCSAAGIGALVFGCARAASDGWGSPVVLGLLAVGAGLLGLFAAGARRAAAPLLPPRVVWHPARGGALCGIGLMFVAVYGFYLFMSYYLQDGLGYGPVRAGAALLVNAVAALVGATVTGGRTAGRVRPAWLVVAGLLVAAAGMVLATRLPGAADGVPVLTLALTGLGLGCVLPVTTNLATAGLGHGDVGPASAASNAAQQLGAAVGTALLNTVAVHGGYATALTVAAAVLCAAALVAGPLIAAGREPVSATRSRVR